MRLSRLIAVVCALLVPSSALASELAAMAASSRAMACCEAMKQGCAGVQAPDDCCQTQKASVGLVSSAISTSLRVSAAPIPVAVLSSFRGESVALPLRSDVIDLHGFKRPHDPPHLHIFHLLI